MCVVGAGMIMFINSECICLVMKLGVLAKEKGYIELDVNGIDLAQEFSGLKLSGSRRLSGDSCFDHNVRIGAILIENKSEPEVVISGILQGILKVSSEKEVMERFGPEVLGLVKGVEELRALKLKNNKVGSEALRRILLTALRDVRVVLIKLASKIDNLQSVGVLDLNEQKRIATEVIEVYAPLANRLGVEKMKVLLEDSALQILNPRKYKEIENFLEESREEREKSVVEIITLIRKMCEGSVEILGIKGRSKHIYSIYKKIVDRGVSLRDQYDLLGVRVIVRSEKECYTLLGLVHENLDPLEDRLKDYISNPKANGYRSIHTGVRLPSGKILEIQIRTAEMDEIAEEGFAAHWRYKKVRSNEMFEKKIAWLRGVLDLQKSSEDKEFLETVKVDLFGDTIYCYTPKGDVKELPKGARVLDFAYMVHQAVGDHCIGARVNGKFVPLKEELHQGDIIEVLTNKSQRPRSAWLKMVMSGRTRQKIRKSLRENEKVPVLHYRKLQTGVVEEQEGMVECEEYPAAVCSIAKCCFPIPADAVVGLITKHKVVSVHRDDCRQIGRHEDTEKVVSVAWKNTFSHKIRFIVEATERSGVLADILHTIAQAGFEVKEAKAKMCDVGKVECSFLLMPRDLAAIVEMVLRVRKVRGILKVHFE